MDREGRPYGQEMLDDFYKTFKHFNYKPNHSEVYPFKVKQISSIHDLKVTNPAFQGKEIIGV
ncbi:hypothetical protein [Bacillus salipaludis]|uniref:hypothetical protein n=1 Tax=Bacillus salipaludis TaxID=2547811 RepID=UPI0035578651